MLELEQARERILTTIPTATPEAVPAIEADGRVLAQALNSPVDLPLFDNSAMDGYAVRSADIAEATPQASVTLELAGKIAAGQSYSGRLSPGTCVRIFTGSPVPAGADAIVMQEDTQVDSANPVQVRFLAPAQPDENIRRAGGDVRRGARLLAQGGRLGPAQISLLAAAGIYEVNVGIRPTVGLLATGTELREAGATEPRLRAGEIYESNRAGLAALIRRAGGLPKVLPLVADDLADTRHALESGLRECDFLVTSGGVSVGELDHVKQAFAELGGELRFWKVAIKPGRPFVFGRWRQRSLFGLPGNPVSALVTFLLLARPALLRWQGATDVSLPAHLGRLAEPIHNRGERRHFLRVRVDTRGEVRVAGAQASHVLSSLAVANGLLDVPPQTTWPAGTAVSVLRWE